MFPAASNMKEKTIKIYHAMFHKRKILQNTSQGFPTKTLAY
jgi:hypothetical protein